MKCGLKRGRLEPISSIPRKKCQQVSASSAAALNLLSDFPSVMLSMLFKLLLLHCISEKGGLHMGPLNVGSPYNSVVFLDLIPIDFQDQTLWGVVFLVPDSKVGVANVTQFLHSLRGNSVIS